jgi:hypothetical protein
VDGDSSSVGSSPELYGGGTLNTWPG